MQFERCLNCKALLTPKSRCRCVWNGTDLKAVLRPLDATSAIALIADIVRSHDRPFDYEAIVEAVVIDDRARTQLVAAGEVTERLAKAYGYTDGQLEAASFPSSPFPVVDPLLDVLVAEIKAAKLAALQGLGLVPDDPRSVRMQLRSLVEQLAGLRRDMPTIVISAQEVQQAAANVAEQAPERLEFLEEENRQLRKVVDPAFLAAAQGRSKELDDVRAYLFGLLGWGLQGNGFPAIHAAEELGRRLAPAEQAKVAIEELGGFIDRGVEIGLSFGWKVPANETRGAYARRAIDYVCSSRTILELESLMKAAETLAKAYGAEPRTGTTRHDFAMHVMKLAADEHLDLNLFSRAMGRAGDDPFNSAAIHDEIRRARDRMTQLLPHDLEPGLAGPLDKLIVAVRKKAEEDAANRYWVGERGAETGVRSVRRSLIQALGDTEEMHEHDSVFVLADRVRDSLIAHRTADITRVETVEGVRRALGEVLEVDLEAEGTDFDELIRLVRNLVQARDRPFRHEGVRRQVAAALDIDLLKENHELPELLRMVEDRLRAHDRTHAVTNDGPLLDLAQRVAAAKAGPADQVVADVDGILDTIERATGLQIRGLSTHETSVRLGHFLLSKWTELRVALGAERFTDEQFADEQAGDLFTFDALIQEIAKGREMLRTSLAEKFPPGLVAGIAKIEGFVRETRVHLETTLDDLERMDPERSARPLPSRLVELAAHLRIRIARLPYPPKRAKTDGGDRAVF